MKITGLLPNTYKRIAAVANYRITAPFNLISSETAHMAHFLEMPDLRKINRGDLAEVLDSDIIVLQRFITEQDGQGAALCNKLKSRGAKLVYETDDDLTGVHRDISKGKGATCFPYLVHCDAVTASTQPLADMMGDFIGKPAYVLPNYIDARYFQHVAFIQNDSEGNVIGERKREYPGTLNLMLAGTPTHGGDWKVVSDVAVELLDKYENVRLLVAGYNPLYLPEHERIELIDPVPYTHYPIVLAEADIVCAAVEPDDHFNRAKSAVKVLEAWAAKRRLADGNMGGAAVIASKTRAYSNLIEDRTNGLLVEHTAEAWRDAIEELITNERLRQRLQRQGKHELRKHNVVNHYQEWVTVYHKILRS